MVVPPQTNSVWPVMKPLAGSSRNATARATSSGRPSRRTGIACASAAMRGSPGGQDLVEHVGLDRPRRDRVDGDAVRPEFQRPGARQPDQPGLGRRIGAARRQPQRGARRHQHDPPEFLRAHPRQHRLRQDQRRRQMQPRQRRKVGERRILQQRRADGAGIVHQHRHRRVRDRLRRRRLRRGLVRQIDRDRTQVAMRQRVRRAVERHHLGLARQQRRTTASPMPLLPPVTIARLIAWPPSECPPVHRLHDFRHGHRNLCNL